MFRRSVPGADLSGDIWIMGADGSSPHPLIALPGDERYPSLSPDGTRLAFTTRPTGEDVEVAVARADGSGASAITDNAVFDSSPSWSPDSRRIAFERGPAGDDPGNDVWSMAADGSDQRQLTTSPGLDEGPAWSPSGSRIAFTSTRSGGSDIWTMAADGSDQQRITTLPGTEESPDWQPLPGTPAVGGAPSGDTAAPAPLTSAAGRSRAPRLTVRLAAGQSVRTLGRRGLVVRIGCSKPCRLDARLRLDRVTARRLRLPASATVGRARRTLRAAGTAKLTIRLTRRARARLATVERAGLRLSITASADGRRETIQRRVTLTRTRAALRP